MWKDVCLVLRTTAVLRKAAEVSLIVIDPSKVISSTFEYSVNFSAGAWRPKLIFVKPPEVSLMPQFWPIQGYLEDLRALRRLLRRGHLVISETKTADFSTVNSVNPLHFLYIQLQMLLLPFFFRHLQCSFAVGRFISILVSVFLVPDKMLFVNLVSQIRLC